MRFRVLAAALVVCGLASLAGCPLGIVSDLQSALQSSLQSGLQSGSGSGSGSGSESSNGVIPDGAYAGNIGATAEFWHKGEPYEQHSGGGEAGATFVNGAALKNSGTALQIGDIESSDWGVFTGSRKVYDVQVGDSSYEVDYDVTAEWNAVPMAGTEFITYAANADGSIEMYDTIELDSLDSYDGGAWTMHASASGTLLPVQQSGGSGSYGSTGTSGNSGSSGGSTGNILDLKSGKIRH